MGLLKNIIEKKRQDRRKMRGLFRSPQAVINYIGGGGPRPARSPNISSTKNITKNKKNNNFAIPAAATAIPVNPKIAAMIAMTKKMAAQVNMIFSL
jgi:hypothetical protein